VRDGVRPLRFLAPRALAGVMAVALLWGYAWRPDPAIETGEDVWRSSTSEIYSANSECRTGLAEIAPLLADTPVLYTPWCFVGHWAAGANPLDIGPCTQWGFGCRYLDVSYRQLVAERAEERYRLTPIGAEDDGLLAIRRAHADPLSLGGRSLRFARAKSAFAPLAVLAGADLRGAFFQSADLTGADLGEAQMQGANLFLAQMQGANLWQAHMQGADLSSARMQGANLGIARMQGADLGAAHMQGAFLGAAHMQGADLHDSASHH
jgi:hypothetical protein